jgi:hypothetical protein
MNWECISRYYLKSDAGYRITRARVGGEIVFTAWPPKPPYRKNAERWQENLHQSIGTFSDSQSAKQACEAHYQPLSATGT